ncbi:pseudouridine synthase [Propionigenium maris DSM 9537]|uniref:Pseudouridine synthase n=1 Tax=Propionigenium maris DSM 9537 TaxID=1123000 RepID=A0A9W6LMU7_9FUSO|nr:RluA family pseudouridine synthase [Propionigenium maris]GLI55997.1 pseudouridine synthase [Propionigenium maris DSM 9537]
MKEYKTIETLCPSEEGKGKRLDAFLEETLEGLTRSYIKKLIDEGDIYIEGKKKVKSGNKLKGSETVVVRIPEDEVLNIEAENLPIDIVFEDESMVIINKGPDMVVHPAPGNYTGTLVNAVMYHIKDLSTINGVIRPGIVHRLDKDTSGLIIIAKNDEAHLKLTDMFKEKTIDKTYVCICKGNFREHEGRIENLIGRNPKDRKKMAVVDRNGKKAISNYRVVEQVEGFTLVEVGIETGRTHQIRVHMKSLNHPILGDEVYGSPSKKAKRQMLHAYKLEFTHPITGEEMKVVGDIPEDFQGVAKNLKLDLSRIGKE